MPFAVSQTLVASLQAVAQAPSFPVVVYHILLSLWQQHAPVAQSA